MPERQVKEVSLIMTVYNYKYNRNFEAVIKSLKSQSVELEIILCEQGIDKSEDFEKFCLKNGIKYLHTLPDIKKNDVFYNIGRVRNIAASVSEGKYLYFNDVDVLINNSNYFEKLIHYYKKINSLPLIRPHMRRLSERTSKLFLEDYLGGIPICFKEDNPMSLVDYDNETKTFSVVEGGEVSVLINNLMHVCERKYYSETTSYLFDPSKIYDFVWKTSFHCGGTFCSFEDFCNVAGFCENYHNWGMEDIDLQWKFNGFLGIQYIDAVVKESSIIHFEHKGRYNNEIYRKNREIFKERLKIGARQSIERDKRKYTFMSNFLRQNIDILNTYLFIKNNIEFRRLV